MIRSFAQAKPRIHKTAFIHSSSEIIGDVTIGSQASVWPMAVLRGDVNKISIGARSNIQDGCVVHCREPYPTVIGTEVTVGHGAIIHGARIGDRCLIGMGAIVMEAVIGADCLVGAGALVVKGMNIPARSLVLGSPAKVIRPLTGPEIESLKKSAVSYVKLAARHAATSRSVQ